ncbi:MAG: M20/M25/M40 family metallo-hydrolase [Candidatus Limnocylindrales bacterium]|jgi:acetylornithine deacetylase/succinyl-diaminopimelate desuccinylase-like protein
MTVEAGGGTTMSAHELSELVELLRALIRIRSVNPPGDEILAARYLEQVLADDGIPSTVVEPFPGRGSIVARLHGDGMGGEPLLLLSHLDVVPADPAGWTHDPFGGEVADGYVWGRGAVDMKGMVAMEVQVVRRLARAARAAGRDPATDPIPGLRRDVIFCSAADEEAGGWEGANWLVENHPDWLRSAGALNEAGGMAMAYAGVRFYPIQVAEKGFVVYRLRVKGRWGHGSVPTPDNAAVLAAGIVTRLAEPGPMRLTEPIRISLLRAIPHLTARAAAAVMALAPVPETGLAGGEPARAVADPARVEAAIRDLCDPILGRTVSAIMRDTVSVGIIRAGVKYNVIPGIAEIELDCRTLPGTDEPAMREELRRRMGEELWARIEIECEQTGPSVQAPLDSPLYRLLEKVVTAHDPDGVALPYLAPFATDAKHLARMGVPTYGFSPLKTGSRDGLLALMHGDDERVSFEALRWGLPVLWDAVVSFCGGRGS